MSVLRSSVIFYTMVGSTSKTSGSAIVYEEPRQSRWGVVPLVEFEGRTLVTAVAIARFFAKKFDLVPEDPYLAALADEYVDAVQDMLNPLYKILFDDPLDKKEKVKQINIAVEANTKRNYDLFDAIIKANGGKYLVGDKLSWADLWLVTSVDQFEIILGKNIAEGRVHVEKLVETVKNHPKLKSWFEKRPKTEY